MLLRQPAAPHHVTRLTAALAALLDAESRGAPEAELRLLQEAVIAARVSAVRAERRSGKPLVATRVRQLERDMELLRRFPADRGGADGVDWFDWPPRR